MGQNQNCSLVKRLQDNHSPGPGLTSGVIRMERIHGYFLPECFDSFLKA